MPMDIVENLNRILNELPAGVKLIAISKNHPEDMIMKVYNAGHKTFGENRVQELISKYRNLPKDIEWHMVGHLQRNKVSYIAPFISLIHSVDSLSLLNTIEKEALKNDRIIDCLLQIKIAREESKFGLSFEEIKKILYSEEFRNFKNLKIKGFMGMATFTSDETKIKSEFKYLVDAYRQVKELFFKEKPYFCELSMGMSSDYKLAIEAGSTMIRIGSLIFGERNYN